MFLPWLALQGLAFGLPWFWWIQDRSWSCGPFLSQHSDHNDASTFSTNSNPDGSLQVALLDAPMGLPLPCNTIGFLTSANWAIGSRGKITCLSKCHWEWILSKERAHCICWMIWAHGKPKDISVVTRTFFQWFKTSFKSLFDFRRVKREIFLMT